MKLIRKNVRSRVLGRPINQEIVLRSAVKNAEMCLEEDPFLEVKHRTYVIESRSKSLNHSEIRTFQKSRKEELNGQQSLIKRVFNLQDLKADDIQLTQSIPTVSTQPIPTNPPTTSLSYLERQKQRLEKLYLMKRQLKKSKKQEVKKKWQSDRREMDFLKEVRDTKEEERLRKNKDFVPLGLRNLGNTCYLNSVLQCFLNLPLFNQYFYGGKYLKDVAKDKTATDLYAKLLFEVQRPDNKNNSESPQSLKQFMGTKNSRFSGNKQQDCTEFLTILLSSMNKELFKVDFNLESPGGEPETLAELSQYYWIEHLKQENSHITKYFGGQIVSTIVCGNCSSSFQKFDNFYDIQLIFSQQTESLEDMFVEFVKPQHLADYRCPICAEVGRCHKQIQIAKSPPILIIQLKRFKQTLRGFQKVKNQAILPFSLDLSKYMLKQTIKPSMPNTFELWGFSKHFGQLNQGHYTTESRSNLSPKWFDFNDSRVSAIAGQKELKSKEAYVLFYVNRIILCSFD